jgi:hypothetical protein
VQIDDLVVGRQGSHDIDLVENRFLESC